MAFEFAMTVESDDEVTVVAIRKVFMDLIGTGDKALGRLLAVGSKAGAEFHWSDVVETLSFKEEV